MRRIPFADVKFPAHNMPSEYDIERRLKKFLNDFREKTGCPKADYALSDADRLKIRRRTKGYINAVSRQSRMGHLSGDDRQKMDAFRSGAELVTVGTEHRADEIAAAIHSEMPWMSATTEMVWQDLRASVRNGDPGPRLRLVLLVGPPGIGKTHWARLLGQQLAVPATVIDATAEPASFSVTGSQRGLGSAGPGKLLEQIMASGIANPIVLVDEIEKAGNVESSKGHRFTLSEGLLPLLERSTSARWTCPYFRIDFDMSWIIWAVLPR